MKYIVERTGGTKTHPQTDEIEASGFKIERGVVIFFREKKMDGIVGTGIETKLIAAYSDFRSVKERDER